MLPGALSQDQSTLLNARVLVQGLWHALGVWKAIVGLGEGSEVAGSIIYLLQASL